MARIVDELITKYTLDASGYQKGADQVARATASAGQSIGGLQGLIGGLAAGAAAGGLFALGKWAVEQAMAFDTMNRSLTAVVGSADRAKQILGFVDELAGPSRFIAQDLGQAALLLEAFGLQTERYLPLAEKLGSLFGGTAADIEQFVRALGMMKGGRAGEALEALARGGITREALMARGLRFNKGGELLSTTSEALDAIESEINAKFGKLSAEMASGPAAKMASLMDAVNKAGRAMGFGILSIAVPAVEKLAGAVEHLVSSGVLQKAVDGVASLFNGEAIGDALLRGMAWFQVALERLPTMATKAKDSLVGLFSDMGEKLKWFTALFVGFFIGPRIIAGILAFEKALRTIVFAIRDIGLMQALVEAIATGGASLVKTLLGFTLGVAATFGLKQVLDAQFAGPKSSITGVSMGDLSNDADAAYNKIKSSLMGTDGEKKPGTPPEEKPIPNLLGAIANNTEKVADNTRKMLDHSRHIFGGGDLGRIGVTPIEIGSRRGSTRIQIDVNGAEGPFRALVETITMQVARQIMAQRA